MNETAELTVTATEGAAVYYTTDGADPTTASTLWESGTISVSAADAPDPADGGIVTVKAIAVLGEGEEAVTSAVDSVTLSFYRTAQEPGTSALELAVGSDRYYFRDPRGGLCGGERPESERSRRHPQGFAGGSRIYDSRGGDCYYPVV